MSQHTPFGIFIALSESEIKSLIKIPDFLDEGVMTQQMYPEIDAVVVGYYQSNDRQVELNAKPSVLHQAFVPLKNRALIRSKK